MLLSWMTGHSIEGLERALSLEQNSFLDVSEMPPEIRISMLRTAIRGVRAVC